MLGLGLEEVFAFDRQTVRVRVRVRIRCASGGDGTWCRHKGWCTHRPRCEHGLGLGLGLGLRIGLALAHAPAVMRNDADTPKSVTMRLNLSGVS